MLDEAKLNLTKALAIKPDHTNAYLNLCEVLEKSNQLNELLKVVDEAFLSVHQEHTIQGC